MYHEEQLEKRAEMRLEYDFLATLT